MPSYKNNLPIQTTINFDTIPTVGSPNAVTSDGIYNSLLLKQDALTNPVTGTGTSGQVAYWSGTSAVTGSSNLFWDNANGRLGVGTASPAYSIDVNGTIRSQGQLIVMGQIQNPTIGVVNINGVLYAGTGVSIGVNSTNTARLLVRGSGTTSATTALLVQNSTPTELLSITDDGLTKFSTNQGKLEIVRSANRVTIDRCFFEIVRDGVNQNFSVSQNNGISTSGIIAIVNTPITVAPTSGTAVYNVNNINPTINQTGGANGITRGLYVNPTLTSAADWRSVEFSNNTGWGIYGAGSANNYLAGSLGIGAIGLTGRGLYVSQNATSLSGSAWVISSESVMQSDVVNGQYFQTFARTQATTFTLTNLRHYSASQGTFGTGSTVTNQYGFHAQSSLIGATNNYGFYGDIPSGTGRWNLYMNGTAANYLAGNTSIGTTTSSGRLTVQGSGTTSATTALLVQNNTPSELLTVRDSGEIVLHGNIRIGNAGTKAPYIFPFTTTQSSINATGTNLSFFSYTINESATNGTFTFTGETLASTFSNQIHLLSIRLFAPTSGTAIHNNFEIRHTINQTGGANGITRGLYVNPTLTSAADWRGLESVAASNANHTLLKLRNATVDVFTVKADSKIGFYNATPAAQATTGIAEAAFVENSGGTTVNVDSTFAGYTLQQIAQALKDYGLLA